jgi:hypothetical protein
MGSQKSIEYQAEEGVLRLGMAGNNEAAHSDGDLRTTMWGILASDLAKESLWNLANTAGQDLGLDEADFADSMGGFVDSAMG